MKKRRKKESREWQHPNAHYRRIADKPGEPRVQNPWTLSVKTEETLNAARKKGIEKISDSLRIRIYRGRIGFFEVMRICQDCDVKPEEICVNPKEFYARYNLWNLMKDLHESDSVRPTTWLNILGESLVYLQTPRYSHQRYPSESREESTARRKMNSLRKNALRAPNFDRIKMKNGE